MAMGKCVATIIATGERFFGNVTSLSAGSESDLDLSHTDAVCIGQFGVDSKCVIMAFAACRFTPAAVCPEGAEDFS